MRHKQRKKNKCRHHDQWKYHKMHHKEFMRYRRILHTMPVLIVLVTLVISALLFQWSGRESFTTLMVVIFVFLIIKEILQALFFKRISRRFIEPLINLKTGFDAIGEGDYSVRVEAVHHGDMNKLFKAFNAMAHKLEENEHLKRQYEDNRKQLIANISHDLKTPITTVQGYIEVLEEGVVKDPDKTNRYLKIMKSNTEYINRLIDDLFLFSKLDIDQVQFEFSRVNAHDFFNDMMEEFQISHLETGFKFSYENDIEASAWLHVDGKRLYRAIKNIVDNSEKYASVGQVTKVNVDLSTRNGFLTLKFRDYGPGIPDDKLSHIFDRFYRVDDERTKMLNSTGLGLAIAKELIVAHEGHIVAGNHKAGGAIFIMQLPLCV